MAILSTTTGNITTGTPLSAAGGQIVRSSHSTPAKLLHCGIISWQPRRGECLRVIAEQEIWQAVVCKGAKELRQCVFRDEIQLAVVDLPQISSAIYESFREQTEWLSQLGTRSGTSGLLLVVCAAGESVQEEIWARQLGVWSYLPLVKLTTAKLTTVKLADPMVILLNDQEPMDSSQDGLPLLFRGAREALSNTTRNFSDGPEFSETAKSNQASKGKSR
ncbi:MAG: hypothetical protein ABGX16_00335 [Pirellulales bacterium]